MSKTRSDGEQMRAAAATETAADREIVVARLIEAPRELVFAAFTEREHIENWWVPRGTTIHEWDPQPGGLWRYSQPGPNGTAYPFKISFVEIIPPARLVYDFATDSENAPAPVRTTVTFEEQDGKTRVTLRLRFATAAEREEAAKHGGAQGARLALERLAGYMAR